MNISKSIQTIMNEQINAELYSSYMYLSMAAYFEGRSLPGMAHWMKLQAQEEVEHAMKFFDYIFERGGNVTLNAIDKPPTSWKSPLDAFTAGYKHEQKVTKLIHDIVNAAQKEKDHASVSFLQWFIDEQVEEETSADAVVQKLTMIGNHKPALLMLDRELGSRKEE